MKKLIALFMVCGLALTFAACGGGNKEADNQQEEPNQETVTPAPEETPAPADTTTTESDTTGNM